MVSVLLERKSSSLRKPDPCSSSASSDEREWPSRTRHLRCGSGRRERIQNATGVRVRDYPITLDKLITKLPAFG